jgi:hypothetical protein
MMAILFKGHASNTQGESRANDAELMWTAVLPWL